MPVYFYFAARDPFIRNRTTGLSGTEIAAVTRWQGADLDYGFSFHEKHEKGHPLYVCKDSEHGQRSMTKADLKDKTALTFDFVNADKLLKAQLDDARAVVSSNIEVLQKLAKNYYEGVEVLPVANIPAPTLNCKQCQADITKVKITKGKRVCPGCSKWN